jgi:hypothetical protein
MCNGRENQVIDFETAIKLGEEVLSTLEKLSQIIHGRQSTSATPDGKAELPDLLLQFRRQLLATHSKRHLVTELAATGKLTESEARAMVDSARSAANTAVPANASGAASGWGANILAWLTTNGPTIAADIAAAIPIIISLITLFGG